jgi:hypothetical protein
MSTTGTLGTQTSDLLHRGHITTAGGPLDTNSYVRIISGEGASTWVADMRGTFSAGTTLVFEVTVDGVNWVPDAGTQVGSVTPALTTSVSGPGPLVYTGSVAALQQFRVRATSIAGGDDVIVSLRLSVGVGASLASGGGGGGGVVYQGTNPWIVAGQGTAGSPATGIITVQGIPGASPVTVEPNLPTVPRLESAVVNAGALGNNTLVTGIGGETIRVFKLVLSFSTGTTVVFQDGASTPLSGPVSMLADGSMVLDLDTEPWFLTSAGNDFVMNLSAAGTVGGRIYYTQS